MMTRKQLENCAFRESARPGRERRDEIMRSRWDWESRRFVAEPAEKLTGENRQIRVFNPSGTTEGSMNVFMPLWSLYKDELEQACSGRFVTMRAPYSRVRKGYKGSVKE